MKFNIVSFEKEQYILLNNRTIFEDIKKYYYIVDNNIIEYSWFNEFSNYDIIKKIVNKNKEKRTIFLLSSFSEESIKIITEANKYNKNNIVIIDNKDTLKKARSIFIINNLRNILYLPQLKNSSNGNLSIDLILKFINGFFCFKSNEERHISIKESITMYTYVERKSIIKDIVMNVLENFNLIQYEGIFHLNIYNSNMNLQELSYIEDPLKEYMHYNSSLIIKQLTNKGFNERVFFSIRYTK